MVEQQWMDRIERAYWGPKWLDDHAILQGVYWCTVGLWLGALMQIWMILHPSAWRSHRG